MFDEFVKKQDEIRRSTRRRNLKSKFASDVYINISDDTIELINSFLILSEENHSNMYQLDRKEIIDGLKKEHTI
jgi:hypothetical protein